MFVEIGSIHLIKQLRKTIIELRLLKSPKNSVMNLRAAILGGQIVVINLIWTFFFTELNIDLVTLLARTNSYKIVTNVWVIKI